MKRGSITRYRLKPKRPPKTDWRAFDAMSEDERHQAALSHPVCRLRLKPNLHVFGASRVFQLGVSHHLWTIV